MVLPLLPWLLIARTTGVLLLGPHMWVVGERSRAAAAAEAEKASFADRYAKTTDPTEKWELLNDELKRQDEEEDNQEKAEEKAQTALPFSEHAAHRRAYNSGRHLAVVVPGSRVPCQRFPGEPCPMRSSAAPEVHV